MNNKTIVGVILAAIIIGGLFFFSRRYNQLKQPTTPQPTQLSVVKVEPNTITIKNMAFNPDVVIIKPGAKVVWLNQDTVPHTIKSTVVNSEDINQGDKFEFTFTTKGTFDYLCGIHPAMTGKVIVE